MISKINLSTGPVAVSAEVMKALQEPPMSHRSREFLNLYFNTTQLLCDAFQVRETFLLSGSGTLANEAMLQEIKCIDGKGLIISNGEFGERLINQAGLNSIQCITHQIDWGLAFNLCEIEKLIVNHSLKWILFCHCETSTGVINDLQEISAIAKRNDCFCFADCMSTVGTRPLNLSNVSMASASSGKGLASLPGIAIVFANIAPFFKTNSPVYLDLHHYSMRAGIPFTFSSNLLKALHTSIRQKLKVEQYELIHDYGGQFFNVLNEAGCVPFSNSDTRVFTIIASRKSQKSFVAHVKNKQILLSGESSYLKARNWCQLATFGLYKKEDLQYVLHSLKQSAQAKESAFMG